MAPRLITDEMYASIPALIAEGLDRKQIAERFGTTPSSLQVMCCRRGISLWKRDRPKHQAMRLGKREVTMLNLPNKHLQVLHDRAQALGMDEAGLATKLLNMIIKDDLFVAVLDKEPA